MNKPRKLLAVLAHPDDETFICGGTIAKYVREGVDITLLCATKGEMGRRMGMPPFTNREAMPALREQELVEACAALGIADLRFLGLRDKLVEFAEPKALAGRIAKTMHELRPDVVLTFHEKLGGHPDHCAIGKAATQAFEESGLSETGRLFFISYGDALKRPERWGVRREDVTAIDVTGTRPEKLRAYRAHRSQTELDPWLWLPDEEAVGHFSGTEYFIQGNDARRSGETDLFEYKRQLSSR